MAERRKQKSGAVRSQMLGIRLDPELRYLVELACRKQRRSILSYVEWALEQSLQNVFLDGKKSVIDERNKLWKLEEPDRVVALALAYPELLTYEEQRIWAVVDTYRIPVLDDKTKKWLTFKFPIADSADNRHDLAFIRRCWDEITRFSLEGKAELDAAMIKNYNDMNALNYKAANR